MVVSHLMHGKFAAYPHRVHQGDVMGENKSLAWVVSA
jgi:hypothetical protein